MKEEESKIIKEEEKLELILTSTAHSSRYIELELLQEELKGKLRANDGNVKEIVEKISLIQSSLYQADYDHEKYKDVIPSLEYYTCITSDLTKIVRNIIKTQKISKDRIISIFREEGADHEMLSGICYEFFKRFVVYD